MSQKLSQKWILKQYTHYTSKNSSGESLLKSRLGSRLVRLACNVSHTGWPNPATTDVTSITAAWHRRPLSLYLRLGARARLPWPSSQGAVNTDRVGHSDTPWGRLKLHFLWRFRSDGKKSGTDQIEGVFSGTPQFFIIHRTAYKQTPLLFYLFPIFSVATTPLRQRKRSFSVVWGHNGQGHS